MFQIKRAKRNDYKALLDLINRHGKFSITPEMLNKRDIALKAVDSSTGEIIGFIHGGLFAQNTMVYINTFTVDFKYAGMGIGEALSKELFQCVTRVGVKEGFAIIRRDEYHERSAINCLKAAMCADPFPCTYVYGDLKQMTSELSKLRIG